MTLPLLIIKSALCIGAVMMSRKSPVYLGAVIATFMLLIGFVGGKEVLIFGIKNNVGNIFYSGALIGIYVMLERHGVKPTYDVIHTSFLCMMLATIAAQIAILMPVIDGNELISECLKIVNTFQIRVITASFLAYYVTMFFFVMMRRKDALLGSSPYVHVTVAQFIDSIIFFPIAFGASWMLGEILLAILSGWVLKSVVSMIGVKTYRLFLANS